MEGRLTSSPAVTEADRLSQLAANSRHLYLFSVGEGESDAICKPESCSNVTFIEEKGDQAIETGPFILISDPRFSVLLASYALPQGSNGQKYYEVVWTLEPNAVFTAIEYFTARIASQKPDERASLEALLNISSPHSVSLRLALTITTKLTMLMQRQNELESAINRISSAINSTLELDSILQSVVEEVGRTMKANKTTLTLLQEGTNIPEDVKVFEQPDRVATGPLRLSLIPGLASTAYALLNGNGNSTALSNQIADLAHNTVTPGRLEVPVTYRDHGIGRLVIEDHTPGRVWEDEERLMALTVSDQLAIAISHARLFSRTQTLALTDPLTGLYNQRYFQDRVEREIKLADRKNNAVSLIMLDIDGLKGINDTLGHTKGDAALVQVADILKTVLREIDICARFGGEEFVAILPDCGRDDAMNVAERMREAVATSPVHLVGQITISVGVATYPAVAKSTHELIEQADLAMCMAKAAGRNRVRTITNRQYGETKSSW
jgi:diguanylate cyclase (GGDEF)-like protein